MSNVSPGARRRSRPAVAGALVSMVALAAACSSTTSAPGGPAGSNPTGTAAGVSGAAATGTSPGGCQSGALTNEALLTTPSDAHQDTSYSNSATAVQAKNCDGMRSFLSSPQPGFDLQSYVFYGYLRDKTGKVIPFSNLNQQSSVSVGNAPKTAVLTSGMTVDLGQGMFFGGVAGTPNQSVQVSQSSNPFSMRSQSFTAGQAPSYVDARVVNGQLGQPGAELELTAQITTIGTDGQPTPTQISVLVQDVAGVGQWGFGPSGFFPQWIYPEQRSAIEGTYGGSVDKYLQATNDPMTDQGSYYYTSPVARVERFTVTQKGQVVSEGTDGELLLDYVTQSFDQKAAAVVGGGVQWLEYSVLLDGGKTMKIGQVSQSSVGQYPYAMLLSTDGARSANGSLIASQRWNMNAIQLTPAPGKTWTSPRSNKTYPTGYTAKLDDPDPAKAADLQFTALYDDQEVDIGGRVVYEGIFKVTGTLQGKPTSGYAWAEIQPSGTL